eukprot:11223977-Lingulodinium_polyedra.AAC.1
MSGMSAIRSPSASFRGTPLAAASAWAASQSSIGSGGNVPVTMAAGPAIEHEDLDDTGAPAQAHEVANGTAKLLSPPELI